MLSSPRPRLASPLLLAAACLLPACHGCRVSAWSQVGAERTEELEVRAPDADTLRVRTHNGWIRLRAGEPGVVQGTAIVEGRGWDAAHAEAVLANIEVSAELVGSTVALGWRWREPRGSGESAIVRFELAVPPEWRLDLESHNGDLVGDGVGLDGGMLRTHNGDLRLVGGRGPLTLDTHNGTVELRDFAGELEAESHNGALVLAGRFDEIDAATHNADVRVHYAGDGPAPGNIETHNGDVDVDLGARDATVLVRGGGRHEFSLGGRGRVVRSGDEFADVEVGDSGAARLTLRTHNGGVTLTAGPAAVR